MRKLKHTPPLLALLVFGSGAIAQGAAPSEALDFLDRQPPRPLRSDQSALPPPPAAAASAPGGEGSGPTLQLETLELRGNLAIPSDELLAALGDWKGRRYTLAQLRALTDTLMGHYRRRGYPFVQVYVPPQSSSAGALVVQIVEGRFGQVLAVGTDDAADAQGAQPFLDHGLRRGEVIRDADLERTLLILDDQPARKVRPVLRPGGERGEGDLLVEIRRTDTVSGELGLDNAGNRNTGSTRATANLRINSPWRYGDKLSFSALYTDRRMGLGSAEYETPLGPSGLRGMLGMARTSYQLGGEFAELDAAGYARVATARLSYPVLRSQASNLLATLSLQHKRMEDRLRAVEVVHEKSSRLLVAGLQFDRRDALGGGGVTYGLLSLTAGRLNLDAGSLATDALTARTQGGFQKLNLDIARIQKLGGPFTLYGRLSAQWAAQNLDASEKFGAGGSYGVRAYPMGEGSGDAGWLAQLELRMEAGPTTPFLFVDGARTRANVESWDAGSAARRALAGAGLGLRASLERWTLEATLAARLRGGTSTAERPDRNPRLFLRADYRF